MQEDDRVNCTACKFTLSYSQYRSRIMSNSDKGKPKDGKKWKWQNLHKDLCVSCEGGRLLPIPGSNKLKCRQCPFQISQTTVDRILADENHSANRYKTK